MQEYTALAFCAVGAEKIVSNELKKIFKVYTILESGFGRVRFKTNLEGLYLSLMSLRAADRLLLEAANFYAADFDALFEGVRRISWENYIPRGFGLVVGKVRTNRSTLRAETSIQSIVHKAAAQRLCAKYGINRLPEAKAGSSVQGAAQTAELRVHLEKDRVSVLLDLCGDPLFKRGYRPAGGIAPLRESTAAAIILLSMWKRKFPLYDPLCGSGTILAEAAMYAWDMAPGLGRTFMLSHLLIGNNKTEEAVRKELAQKVDFTRPISIQGSDTDEKAVSLAKANLKRAIALPGNLIGGNSYPRGTDGGLMPGVKINCIPMEQARPAPGSSAGYIITNPPYGKRLGDTQGAEQRYRDMAALAKAFPGWRMALICDHSGFESFFGKKADSCRELKSGAIDAWLYQYNNL